MNILPKKPDYVAIRRDVTQRLSNAVSDHEAKCSILEDYNKQLIEIIDTKDAENRRLKKELAQSKIDDDIKKLAIRNIARHGMKYVMTGIFIICACAYYKVEDISTIVAVVSSMIGLVSGVLMTAIEAKDPRIVRIEEENTDERM